MKRKEWTIHETYADVESFICDREEIMEGEIACKLCSHEDCENCIIFQEACQQINQCYLEDEKVNLNIRLDNHIIAFADLGFWNGRTVGYKVLGSNLNSIFDIAEDDNRYYVDSYNIKARLSHHDGTHYITYRELRPQFDVEYFKEVMEKYDYNLTPRQIRYYTKSIRPYIKRLYGI